MALPPDKRSEVATLPFIGSRARIVIPHGAALWLGSPRLPYLLMTGKRGERHSAGQCQRPPWQFIPAGGSFPKLRRFETAGAARLQLAESNTMGKVICHARETLSSAAGKSPEASLRPEVVSPSRAVAVFVTLPLQNGTPRVQPGRGGSL
jgi:hypothetical protein